jgi:hypothetical protein
LWTKGIIERRKENRVFNFFVTREGEPSQFLYLPAIQVQRRKQLNRKTIFRYGMKASFEEEETGWVSFRGGEDERGRWGGGCLGPASWF